MSTENASNNVVAFNNVSLACECDDLVVFRFHGAVDGPDMAKALDFHAQWASTKPHIFILADLRHLDRFTFSARREIHAGRSKARTMTTICFGTSFQLRIVVEMILRAVKLLGRISTDIDMQFVASEADARAIVARKRASTQ